MKIDDDVIVKEEETVNDSHINEKEENLDEYGSENDIADRISDISHTDSIKSKKIEKKLKENKKTRKRKPKLKLAKELTDKKENYSCKECSSSFVTERNYNLHIMNHKQCPECRIYLPSQRKLDRHIRQKHRGEKLYTRVCTLCGRQFFSNTAFDYHMRSHTGERPYECNICHKKFKIISHLNAHRQSHTGVKRHMCHLCKKSFVTNVCLKTHLRIHTGERPFVCKVCNKPFVQRTNMKLHMKVHKIA